MAAHMVSADDVERTITAFARLDQRGDKKAMNKLAQRLQREQPFLLQHAAAVKNEHGDTVGEAAVFYATLIWAMFDRGRDGTLPRLTAQNLADADKAVTDALSARTRYSWSMPPSPRCAIAPGVPVAAVPVALGVLPGAVDPLLMPLLL